MGGIVESHLFVVDCGSYSSWIAGGWGWILILYLAAEGSGRMAMAMQSVYDGMG